MSYTVALQPDTPIQRVDSLDRLRGCAILGVIAVHVVQLFPTGDVRVDSMIAFGRLGVQLFFIVSGATMCMVWDHDAKRFASPTKAFYIKRLFRILPPYWLAIMFYAASGIYQSTYWAPTGVSAADIAVNVLGFHLLVPTAMNSVVPGGWSIGVEVLFYAVFPLLQALQRKPCMIFIVVVITSVAAKASVWFALDAIANWLAIPRELAANYIQLGILNQCKYFLVGFIVYRVSRAGLAYLIASPWPIATLAAVVASDWPDGIFFTLVLLPLVFVAIRGWLPSLALASLGRSSYSIYLFHFAILELVRICLNVHTRSWAAFGFVYLLTIVLATLIGYGFRVTLEAWCQQCASSVLARGRRPSPAAAPASRRL